MHRHTGMVGLLLVVLGGFVPGTGPAVADCSGAQVTPLAELRAGRVAEGRHVTIEGVVTGVFTGADRLGGFFLQEGDTPPVGLFVYAPTLEAREPKPGDRVQVAGRFARFHERPQVSRITDLNVCSHIGLPLPVALRLPEDAARLADLRDVKVRLDQTLTVTGNAQLGRYGSLQLAAGGRLFHPGQDAVPERDLNSARQIVLDDGSYRANPLPIPYLDADGTRRVGDQIAGLTGILTYAFDAHRIHPTRTPVFHSANPRPPPPTAPDGTLRVATLNVENYFLTLGSRGASNRAELRRQRQKLTAGVRGVDADVLSLTEVENHGRALDDLVATLNRGLPTRQRYRAVANPDAGTDPIRNALLYRPARVYLLGTDADLDPVHNRAPLLAWFRPTGDGDPFGVVAVHFKAKVGCPSEGDVDRGQGCWNELRTAQSRRLLDWLDRVRRNGAPVLIAGDVNAYAAEDPVVTLLAAGKRDLTAPHLSPSRRYTYVFRGEAGQLDYLLAGPALAGRVSRAAIWHINADEPPFLGFSGRTPGAGPWRSSDHDPVWADMAY
nr:ExeM/NucH family extracellular endonuclease [Thioalkalivibrio sp.]